MKQRGYQRPTSGFKPILMPRNTGAGFILAALSTALGFALIWHIWWLAAASFAGLVVVAIHHTFNYEREFRISAEHVRSVEAAR
jgi:cytochrome o ubiquinol oxidase subunit 1